MRALPTNTSTGLPWFHSQETHRRRPRGRRQNGCFAPSRNERTACGRTMQLYLDATLRHCSEVAFVLPLMAGRRVKRTGTGTARNAYHRLAGSAPNRRSTATCRTARHCRRLARIGFSPGASTSGCTSTRPRRPPGARCKTIAPGYRVLQWIESM